MLHACTYPSSCLPPWLPLPPDFSCTRIESLLVWHESVRQARDRGRIEQRRVHHAPGAAAFRHAAARAAVLPRRPDAAAAGRHPGPQGLGGQP